MPAVFYAASPLREWTTAQACPRERLDYWVGAICEAFLEMDCQSRVADCFDGRLTHLPLTQLALNRVEASTQDVYRTPVGIARSRALPFYLITQTEQPWQVRQGGRIVQLRAGDAVLVDSAQTYELHFPHSVTCLSVQMPRAWVGTWLQTVDTREARVAHRECGWGAMLSALSLQLGRSPELALQMAPSWLEEQFGALLAAVLEPPPMDHAGGGGVGQGLLHRRALARMRERLGEPDWRVTDLAAELGVSPRTLHRAFAAAGETVAARWRHVRMEHAGTLLLQARLSGLTMAEIGRRCGYTDASHFAREFQRVHGETPKRWAQARRP